MIQAAYTARPEAGYPGMLANSWSMEKGFRHTLINAPIAAKQTIGTMTVTKGANAGDYGIQVIGTHPNGSAVNITKTYSAQAGDTATIVAAGLVAAVNNDTTLNDFLSLSNTAGVITLSVVPINTNVVTSIAGTASGSGNALTASPTITNYAANGAIAFGYAVGQYGGAQINHNQNTGATCSPITTATNLTIAGIAIEAKAGEFAYPSLPSSAGAWAPNEAVPIAGVGTNIRIWVPVAAPVVSGTVPGVLTTTGQLTVAGAGIPLTGAMYISDQAVAGSCALVQL